MPYPNPPLVYRATNTITRKTYIGATERRLQERMSAHRWDAAKGSRMPFHHAIRKYGFYAFSWEIVACFDDPEDAYREEVRRIRRERPAYNASAGGRHPARPGNCRSVKCITDGQVFRSAAAAARKYGLSNSWISDLCKGGGATATGLRFSYIELPKMREYRGAPSKPVRCINDGRLHASVREAAAFYGVDPTSIGAICGRRPKAFSVKGLIFRFAADETDEVIDLAMVGDRRIERAVVCCADGKRYSSIGGAAEAYGVSLSAISNVLRGKAKTAAGGRVFRYASDPAASEIVIPNKLRAHTRRVLCETDGKEYASVTKAALAYGINFRTVSAAALTARPTEAGLMFRYL